MSNFVVWGAYICEACDLVCYLELGDDDEEGLFER